MADQPPFLSVILPAWNEGEGIVRLAEALLGFPEVGQLIVVDDASADDTVERWRASAVARDPRVVFRRNERRLGLACSILQCLRLATGEFVLVRDSDFNHDVEDLPRLLALARSGHDLVIASRYKNGIPRIKRFNDILSFCLSKFLSLRGRHVTDWTYGYFLARRSLLLAAPAGWIFRGRGEYSVRLYRWLLGQEGGLKVAELPTVVRERGGGVSSTRPLRHGLAYLGTFLESPPGREGELLEGMKKALRKWSGRGGGVAACGHSRLGLRSRLALLEREKSCLASPLLDLGCGNGAFTALALGGRPIEASGVELDPLFLAEARPLYKDLFPGDLRKGIPAAAAGPYATILCFEMLQYLGWQEIVALFREAKMRAAPGASLLCLFPHRGSIWHRARYLLGFGPEDYLAAHDAALVIAAAEEAGWSTKAGWSCGYGSVDVRAVESLPNSGLGQAHFLLRFQA